MTGIGEFLAKAIEWVYEFWPLRIVNEWEQGIRLRSGAIGKKVLTSSNGIRGGGLHAFWPKLGEIITFDCNWEVSETVVQSLVSKCGKPVAAGFAIQWRISDLRLLYIAVHDQEASILKGVRAAAGTLVPTMRWEELQAVDDLSAKMLAATKKAVWGWGLDVKFVIPTTLADAAAYRLILDAPTGIQEMLQPS